MSSTRQDAWSHDEDLLLAEVVLRHIREGSTQLQAFEEVGKQMNRTAAACGFRWNSYVRKQYKSGIELAKKQRKERKNKQTDHSEQPAQVPQVEVNDTQENFAPKISLQDVIEYLKEIQLSHEQVQKDRVALFKETDELRQKLHQLQQVYDEQKKEYNELENEYASMLAIMEKARKMALK
ncbi:RsfA family transcriptional regulator [Bacillus sp. FJAT-49736]|uniref:RsfA family transcriptional regulator n=1 Tax=Bacillus sp. FJAT-49736 TaxID=2833582 RepID=UPI001BC9FB6F|nr:RsfA family transcriptional regulator [Bacillus sp. FJAT-49736]MBS4172409.1 RsfA family transcriptional regulator [Bacillus sp. FJAT-49736]